MILTDAGPLVAIIDGDDAAHDVCLAALGSIAPPMQTTLPVIAETMHILGRLAGWQGQDVLWNMIEKGDVRIEQCTEKDLRRAHQLMDKYQSLPMDFADATLVSIAERLNLNQVFSIDSDFEIYRLHGRRPFDIVP